MPRKAVEQVLVDFKDDVEKYLSKQCFFQDTLVSNDISKVSFDFENFEENADNIETIILNHKMLRFIWCSAGGDWEYPVNYIVYLDNKYRWRGYVPQMGNPYNHKTKQAFGNDYQADFEFMLKFLQKNGSPDALKLIKELELEELDDGANPFSDYCFVDNYYDSHFFNDKKLMLQDIAGRFEVC